MVIKILTLDTPGEALKSLGGRWEVVPPLTTLAFKCKSTKFFFQVSFSVSNFFKGR